MPTAMMILGAFVFLVMGVSAWAVMLINKSLFAHPEAPLAFNIFGGFALFLFVVGWLLDRFDRY